MKQLLLLLVVASISLPSCWDVFGERVKGNGNVRTEERSINDFSAISSYGPYNVYLTQDPGHKVSVEAEDNLLEYIETYVDNGELKVRTKEGFHLSPRMDIRIKVSAPSFSSIKTVGSGDIITENQITNSSAIKLEATGSGNIKANVNAPDVKADITGSGNVNLEGETKSFAGEILGSGNINAYDLRAENVRVEIMGSGNAEVFAAVKLNVEVSGSGDVKYKGGGQVSSSIHGSGSVKKTDYLALSVLSGVEGSKGPRKEFERSRELHFQIRSLHQ